MMIEVDVPVKLESEANLRQCWQARNRRKRQQQAIVSLVVGPKLRGKKFAPPYSVTLTRLGKRKLDDDNLAVSAKGVRDQIAHLLGIDDGDERIKWNYAQAKSPDKDYWLRVRLEAA